MQFSCGETWEAKAARLENWHDFFALLPRTVAEENGRDVCAWLETIQRRRTWSAGWEWYYRRKQ